MQVGMELDCPYVSFQPKIFYDFMICLMSHMSAGLLGFNCTTATEDHTTFSVALRLLLAVDLSEFA